MDGAATLAGPVAYRCSVPYCDCTFTESFSLAEHLKMHAGEKRHICPVRTCGRRFSTPGNLSRHKRLHGPIKPLECPVGGCICTFRSENKLSKHMKFHLGSPVHVCPSPACGKTFSTAGNLNRHVKGHHPAFDARKVKLMAANLKPLRGEGFSYGSPTGADEAPGPQANGSTPPRIGEPVPTTVTVSVPALPAASPAAVQAIAPVAATTSSDVSLDEALDPEQLDVLVSILDEHVKPEGTECGILKVESYSSAQPTTFGSLLADHEEPSSVSVLDDMIRFHIDHLQM
ncbi:hypothetical protein BBJ28_00010688 [Nothophytophthora sp. Chile5]|nr:hypothetical protein BBJ28_00010688 [Nothophytophthora sp. Chile5]